VLDRESETINLFKKEMNHLGSKLQHGWKRTIERVDREAAQLKAYKIVERDLFGTNGHFEGCVIKRLGSNAHRKIRQAPEFMQGVQVIVQKTSIGGQTRGEMRRV
jgi:hypothetical protein